MVTEKEVFVILVLVASDVVSELPKLFIKNLTFFWFLWILLVSKLDGYIAQFPQNTVEFMGDFLAKDIRGLLKRFNYFLPIFLYVLIELLISHSGVVFLVEDYQVKDLC